MDRLITEDNTLEQIAERSIDFDKTDALRAKERALSVEYLRKALADR